MTVFSILLLATVAKVVDCSGVPRLAIDGAVVSGTAVMPSPRVGPGESREALASFAANGVRFSSDVWTMRPPQPKRQWWLGDGEYDFALFDALVNGLIAAEILLPPPRARRMNASLAAASVVSMCGVW